MINETTLHQPNFKFDYDKTDQDAVIAVAEATAKIIRPGIYTNIPEDIYHAMPLPSAHKLWTLRKTSPAHFWDKYFNPNRPVEKYDSVAMNVGKAFHSFVLEPMKAVDQVKCAPKADMRTKEGKATMEAFKKDLDPSAIVLQPYDYERVISMTDAFFKSKKNCYNFKNVEAGLNESTLIWFEDGVKMRGRVDRIFEGGLHDLKTAQDVSRFSFGDSAGRYGYSWQLMIYQRAWYKLTGEVLTPLITAIESERPHGTKWYSIPDAVLEKETETFEKIISIYQTCLYLNTWPSYPEDTESVFTRSTYFDDQNWFDNFRPPMKAIKNEEVKNVTT